MGEVLDLHIRVHDERVRQWWREHASDLKRPSLTVEKVILLGMRVGEKLRRNKSLFDKTESNLPPIDLYHREKILGLSLLDCLKAKILTEIQIRDIHESLKTLAMEFQDAHLREVIKRHELGH